jgi:hypothetical protein
MTEKPLPDLVAELRKLHEAATPPPWRWDQDEAKIRGPATDDSDDDHSTIVETDSGFYGPHGADRELIPAMRNALPRLLDMVERPPASVTRIFPAAAPPEPAVPLAEYKVATTAANELQDLARRLAEELRAYVESLHSIRGDPREPPGEPAVLLEARKIGLLK